MARTVTLDSNLLMPDIAQVFTKTKDLDLPCGENERIRLFPFMVTACVDYDSRHKSRSDVVSRATEVGINGLKQKIEMDMLHLLFCAGLESGVIRPWKWSTSKWNRRNPLEYQHQFIPHSRFIMSQETIEEFDPDLDLSEDLICSDLLGKDQTFQKDLLAKHNQEFDGDLGLRIDSSNGIILTQLPHLPPLMGINTSFDFDSKTCKVTEKRLRVDGREVIHFAYFCAMGVLDHRSVALLDLKNI